MIDDWWVRICALMCVTRGNEFTWNFSHSAYLVPLTTVDMIFTNKGQPVAREWREGDH